MGGNNNSKEQLQQNPPTPPEQRPVQQEVDIPYKVGIKIGEGQYGAVHRGTHRTTGKVVAIKSLWRIDPTEVETLRKADHENIVRLIDFLPETRIILEFCEFGSLDKYLQRYQPVKKERMKLTVDMSAGLAYLHGIHIIHRDLKPANILVDKDRVAKIADFGLAKVVAEPGSPSNVDKIYMDTRIGTISYMAPEVFEKHYNLQADVFSLGLVFVVTLSHEYKEKTEKICIGLKMNGDPAFNYTVPGNLNDFMRELITRMVERDYHDRPKAGDVHQQLLQHNAPRKPPNLSSKKLVAAGIAACIGVKVLLPEEATRLPGNPKIKELTIPDLFHFTKPALMSVKEKSKTAGVDVDKIDILFKSTGGSMGRLGISSKSTVADLKKRIASNSSIPEESLQLFHRSFRIEDENQIELDGIGHGSVVHVHTTGEDSTEVVYQLDDLLDPGYNYDFTNEDDGDAQYNRGGHVYQRPCGFYRHAIRVKGLYSDDVWLGDPGIRTQSSSKEWPVSYHGSKMRNSDILGTNSAFRMNDIQGVTTTPSFQTVADKFAETFHFEGNTYKIALQNRVNPDQNNGHMIVIPGEGSDPEYWVSPKEDPNNGICDVRPYGILIRLVDES